LKFVRVVGVGDFGLTSPDDFDRVDVHRAVALIIQACQASVGDPFAVWRIGRLEVVVVVVGELDLILSTGVDHVDLVVVSVRSSIGDPLAIRREGSVLFVPIVVGDFGLTATTGVYRADLPVVSVFALIGDLLAVG
jgi:hypothetical protein